MTCRVYLTYQTFFLVIQSYLNHINHIFSHKSQRTMPIYLEHDTTQPLSVGLLGVVCASRGLHPSDTEIELILVSQSHCGTPYHDVASFPELPLPRRGTHACALGGAMQQCERTRCQFLRHAPTRPMHTKHYMHGWRLASMGRGVAGAM